jgi:GBP family porin
MKKSFIGLAAVLACAPLLAQNQPSVHTSIKGTDLTIYGVVDVYAARYTTTTAAGTDDSKYEVGSGGASGSRLGFLATRSVNADLTVGGRYEAGINTDDGTAGQQGGKNRIWSRQAYLSLNSKRLGEVRVGRLQGPTYDFMSLYDPMLMPTADGWGVVPAAGGFSTNPAYRVENSIEYISPRFNGVQVKASLSAGENSATVPAFADISVIYETGPLSIGFLYNKTDSTAGLAATPASPTALATIGVKPRDSVSETSLAAYYDFGVVKPYITIIRKNLTDANITARGAVTNANSESVSLLGAIIPVSQDGQVRVSYGKYGSGKVEADAIGAAIAYTHNVDPGLMLYTAYSRLTQDDKGTARLFNSPQPLAGKSVNAIVAGVTWRF